jgi:putative DNA primase/helicase
MSNLTTVTPLRNHAATTGHAPTYTTTPAELAQRFNLRPQTTKGQIEYHGANPFGEGATDDGFILNNDGTAWDRKTNQKYKSWEIAKLAGLTPEQYQPTADYKARNGHAQPNERAQPNTAPRPPKAAAATPKATTPKPKPKAKNAAPRVNWETATIYEYTDEAGVLLFQVARDESGPKKEFEQRRPNARGGWIYKLDEKKTETTPAFQTRRVLYNLPDVLKAKVVLLVEGEKAADRINDELKAARLYGDIVATTNPHGAGTWRAEYSAALAEKTVFIFADNDEKGRAHAAEIAAALHGAAHEVKVIHLDGLQEKQGADDWIDAGHDISELVIVAEEAPQWEPATDATPDAPEANQTAREQFPLNEIGNGQRFAAGNAAEMRYCSVSENWYIHRAGRWQPDESGEAERRAKQIGQSVAAEAAREPQDDQRARLLKHAITLTKRATRETMLKDAASEPNMTITPEQFDTSQNLFNLANGTINLQTFEFYPPRAADLLTLQSPVAFDSAAQCPTWRACMARWIPDEPTRDYMQESFGVSLSGKVFEEFFNFLYGAGDNGKSTFLRVLEQLCGTYWHKTQAETIMQARDKRQANAPAPELLALKGARLVTVHEIDSKHTLNATLIKDLTGRDAITARGLFEKRPTTFEPQFTLWMFGNGKPRITDTSGGMWRRPRLIDFGQPIPPNERDPQLCEKLRAELPGILNWTLDGLRRVYERGLVVPEAVKTATAAYQAEQDPISDFIGDCCIVGPEFTAKASDLWEAWETWSKENGERIGTQRALGIELKRRKFGQDRTSSARVWQGIGLVDRPLK